MRLYGPAPEPEPRTVLVMHPQPVGERAVTEHPAITRQRHAMSARARYAAACAHVAAGGAPLVSHGPRP